MPLQPDTVHLPISGLDGKTHRLMRRPGTLDRAINAELLQLGNQVVAQKRTGYQIVNPSAVVGLAANDVVMIGCATLGDELVVLSYDHVLGLGDRGADLRGDDAFVYRGPNNRGACRVFHVSTSRIAQGFTEETPP